MEAIVFLTFDPELYCYPTDSITTDPFTLGLKKKHPFSIKYMFPTLNK